MEIMAIRELSLDKNWEDAIALTGLKKKWVPPGRSLKDAQSRSFFQIEFIGILTLADRD